MGATCETKCANKVAGARTRSGRGSGLSPTASQAALPLTAGGRLPLAGGSGLQYSSMARVSIEKLTQWKPVHTMQKSLRMNCK